MKKRLRKESGFTLIELLIVVIILAVLAAIVVFAVGTLAQRGRESACKTDFASVQTAQEAKKAETGTYGTLPQLKDGVAGRGPWLRTAPPTAPATAEKPYGFETDADDGDVRVSVWKGSAAELGANNEIAQCEEVA